MRSSLLCGTQLSSGFDWSEEGEGQNNNKREHESDDESSSSETETSTQVCSILGKQDSIFQGGGERWGDGAN